jgi:hypothetical protein
MRKTISPYCGGRDSAFLRVALRLAASSPYMVGFSSISLRIVIAPSAVVCTKMVKHLCELLDNHEHKLPWADQDNLQYAWPHT